MNVINSLETAADAYIANPTPELFVALVEWMAASDEEGGDYTEEELRGMDFESAAKDYLRRRREDRR